MEHIGQLENRRLLAAGATDLEFGSGGAAVAGGPQGASAFTTIAVQGDGKILAAGYLGETQTLERFNAGGTPDLAFGTDGIVKGLSGGAGDSLQFGALLAQHNGRILVGSDDVRSVSGAAKVSGEIRQYDADGALCRTRDFSAPVGQIVELPNRNLLISFPGEIRQYTSSLQPVTTFGTNGVIQFSGEQLPQMGIFNQFSVGVEVFALADDRLMEFSTTSGRRVDGFNNRRSLVLHGFDATTLAIGDSILVAGSVPRGTDSDFAVDSFQSDGTSDGRFLGSGTVVHPFTTVDGISSIAAGIAIRGDGAITVSAVVYPTGQSYKTASQENDVVQLNQEGVFDTSFGSNGIATVNTANAALAIAVSLNQSVVIAGVVDSDAGVAALLPPDVITDVVRDTTYVRGTAGDDTIVITEVRDRMLAVEINGVKQPQVSFVGAIDVRGFAGNDSIDVEVFAEAFIYGGVGNDLLKNPQGYGDMYGQGGNDTILADGDGSIADGDAGNDLIQFSPDSSFTYRDRFDGGSGNDTLIGGPGPDTLDGGPGKDVMVGNGGNDTFFNCDGAMDVLNGGKGIDSHQVDALDEITKCEIESE